MAPVIFQECIERGRDIRVFIANSKVFSVNVLTQHEELIDWRLDPLCTYEPTKLHKAVEAKLKMLLSRLGLHTGSIDLREDSGGELFFLEINPSGQFLFLESDANLPVTAAIADLLLSPSLTKKNRTVKQ
ncbi:MAG: hypothetical protein EKK48_10175 [Candidatus Melainabacteria bacterium]|nr:MAG: hypothetical protein EKK48_10175 [Candidatus Melainabacteria bacterium]